MEATGVYWKPVFAVLEADFEVLLVNAAHMRNVPGRKTDVADAAWIAELLEHGLLRPSFVPPPEFRQLRNLTRYRKTLVRERVRVIQRIEKSLQDAGIKLTSVASSVLTLTGRDILAALVAGERDPEQLANLDRGRLRPKIPDLQEALTGRFDDHHAALVGSGLGHVDYLDGAIAAVSAEIAALLEPHAWALDLLATIPGAHPRRLLAHAVQAGTVQRTRRGLLHRPPQPRRRDPSAHPSPRSPRPPRSGQPGRLTFQLSRDRD